MCSQELKGKVTDAEQKPIYNANIQLFKSESNEFITYTRTDEYGVFSLKLKEVSFPIKLIITHFNYERQELEINNFQEINIALKKKIYELKEVIIQKKQPDIVEKNDTLTYNLNNLLVGSELKLKDILEKLPGITIDNNKKIRFKGTVIDNLLVDGDEFFRNNHQIAIDNLTAEMIEKIELLKNFKDLSTIDGFENNGQSALNIGIKKKFRDLFKGNFDAEGGIKERYKLHNNLYNFGKKTKVNIITDFNNLNENVFSPIDYIEMRKTTGKNLLVDKFTTGINTSNENNLPPFIFSQDNIKTISTKNNTINFALKPTKNKRFEFVSILNQTRLTENNKSFQTFLDGFSSAILDDYQSIGKSLYSSNIFKFENKINDKHFFQTNGYLFMSIDDQKQHLNNTIVDNQVQTLFQNQLELNSLKAGFNGVYKSKISEKLLLEGAVFNDYSFNKTDKKFNSNKNFTGFEFAGNEISQTTNYQWISFGVKVKGLLKLKKIDLMVKFISSVDNETLSNNSNINRDYKFKDTFSIFSNNFSVSLSSTLTNKIRSSIGVEYANNNQLKSNGFEKKINLILPSINFSYKIFEKLSYSLGYSMKQNNPNINNFISGKLIENQRTIWLQSNIESQQMLSDNFNSGLFYTDITKNVFANFFVVYNNNRNQLTNNFINSIEVTQQEYRYIDYGNNLILNSFLSKKFKKIPLGINFSSTNTFSKNKTLANNLQNSNNLNQNTIDFNLKSYFKDRINFDIGILHLSTFNTLNAHDISSKSKLITTSPFIKLDGTLFNKRINWKLNSTYHFFNSSFDNSNPIFDTSFKINYTTKNKVNFYINANNVLNIRENNFKNNFIQNNLMTQQTIMNTLSGFINLGVSFSY